MLFENSENNKKQKYQSIYPSVNEMPSFDDADKVFKNDYTGITPEWDATKKRTKRKLDYLTTPVDTTLSEMRFKNSFGNYMMPKDTPERHRRNYALSNEALDDVVGDYYSNSLKKSFDSRKREGVTNICVTHLFRVLTRRMLSRLLCVPMTICVWLMRQ